MVTLYITDLDGTLLDNNAVLPALTSRMISELTEQGAMISVATARTPATIEPILGMTRMAPELVVMTGSAIWNRDTQSFSQIRLIPRDDIPTMLEVFEKRRIYPFCYVLNPDGRFLDVYHPSPSLNRFERSFVEDRGQLILKTFHLGEKCPAESYGRVALFFGMGTREAIVDVAEELKAITGCYISYYKDTYNEGLWLLEIFAPDVSKAAGVDNLKQRLGADRVVAFGDNLNDIPMLKAADVAVAVGNALPEVKEIAQYVIGPNTEPSVPQFIAADFASHC